jgi:hypothetical protein
MARRIAVITDEDLEREGYADLGGLCGLIMRRRGRRAGWCGLRWWRRCG